MIFSPQRHNCNYINHFLKYWDKIVFCLIRLTWVTNNYLKATEHQSKHSDVSLRETHTRRSEAPDEIIVRWRHASTHTHTLAPADTEVFHIILWRLRGSWTNRTTLTVSAVERFRNQHISSRRASVTSSSQ